MGEKDGDQSWSFYIYGNFKYDQFPTGHKSSIQTLLFPMRMSLHDSSLPHIDLYFPRCPANQMKVFTQICERMLVMVSPRRLGQV